jgi:hypothetical protein
MDETEAAELSPADEADKRYLTVRQAAFIGVGAMVDAGIFALLGAVGEVAGAAGAAVIADRRVRRGAAGLLGLGLRVETQPPQSFGACPDRSLGH